MVLKIINPATESVIEEIASDSRDSVARVFATAQRAKEEWAHTDFRERRAAIARFSELLQRDAQALAEILSSEMGKPVHQARGEILNTRGRIDFFLQHTEKFLRPDVMLTDTVNGIEEVVEQDPLGVVLNISAWNFPYYVSSNVFIPALLTGNVVVFKPSEYATLSGLKKASLLHEAGIPKEVFQVVVGDGGVGALALDQGPDAVFFTGSYATGKKIAEQTSGRLIKVGLELGGKDPAYCTEDVNVKAAAAALADGAMYNAGQSCCAVERLYVHQSIYRDFVAEVVSTARTFTVGNPRDEKTYLGPLARKEQIAFLERQIEDALKKGAKVELGGSKVQGKGYFFEPTVLSNVNHDMALMREETFGPVIGIQSVKDDAEAIKLMNDTAYGLTASVYSRSQERALGILRQVSSGTAYWNCCDRVSPRVPWSGRSHSGIGSTLGKAGIQSFLKPRAWHLRKPS